MVQQLKTQDIIFTTNTHYCQILERYPELQPKMEEIVTSWSQKTIFELAGIKKEDHIGVLYNSPLTVNYVERAIDYFKISYNKFSALNENNVQYLEDFVKRQNVIIAEPPCRIFKDMELQNLIHRKNIKLISFEYLVDKGSVMMIQKKLANLEDK